MGKRNENQTIVITGATRGLGEALTGYCVGQGHKVLGCGRSVRRVEKLNQRFGPAHDFAVVDVSDANQVDHWAHRLLAEHGPPDYLINNAALINANSTLWEVPVDEFSQVVDVNIKGVMHVIRAFTPAMIENASGVIVNFSSTWGRSTASQVAPYCATKFAIEGMTLSLAQELPSGLAAVALNPGVINTDMLQSCFGDGASSFPNAEQWVQLGGPFILQLGPDDNGSSLTVN